MFVIDTLIAQLYLTQFVALNGRSIFLSQFMQCLSNCCNFALLYSETQFSWI